MVSLFGSVNIMNVSGRSCIEAGMLTFLIADVDSEPVAGLVLFHFAGRAYYFYGMSTEHHRECMPTYLLQWKAIQIVPGAGLFSL